ncbi:aldo/keto reductase [Lactococcus garvieae]|jgi:aryl-alcohol dehydrogenase-like predicted oxidoreductase|uniref:Aldo/keto reductase n=1 Tax=Lactococcus garvieae TaxID=1363 RepID=A0AAX3NDC0_9LACT|nr:aldo/keto reductase [Lactococcus garvieae]NHI69294.1 aldo/keto reductase [Lactococcus garvieae]NHJ06550.1 aldo/keto reductase [Lactococcus garvieae]WEA14698.1 aldo/keto reductase [Lactococcus garvieae]
MKYTNLGDTGLKVSKIALGTMNFGEITDEKTAFEIMDRAIELGINIFDTADVYGGLQTPDMKRGFGTSEEIIGRWLAQGNRRDKIILSTKLYQPMNTGINDRGLSAYHIRHAVNDSLTRLQTDHIDLYQMHHVDRNTSWQEIWQSMELLRKQGKITYVGSSNFAGWDVATGQQIAKEMNILGLASEQSIYNLTNRSIESELIPALRYYNTGLLVWSPIGMGVLGGKKLSDKNGRRNMDFIKERVEAHEEQINLYHELCRELREDPAVVALAWVLHNPAVTAPIIGPRSVQQLEQSVRALDINLSEKTLERLDQIWPGPGGEAPENYAW